MQIFGKPRRRFGDVNKAVLNERGLRVQAHDLLARRLVARHAMAALVDQLLDQLRSRGLVLDQHFVRIEQALLLAHLAFERRVFEPPAEEADQKEVLAFNTPGRAHREIAELRRLVGGVPALHDAVERLRPVALAVALEPLRPDETAAEGRRRLLILASEVVFAERATDAVECFERLALRVQGFALPTPKASWSPHRLDTVDLVGFGDRRKAQDLPRLLREDMADEVVLVQPLHDDDNGAVALVVEPAIEGVVKPVGRFSLRLRERLLRF